jgi:tRNA(Ile)-lysidine synthase
LGDHVFSPDALYRHLLAHPRPAGFVVAYSGGMDSHVLLDALVRLRARLGVPVQAVHVNHGLQPAAAAWQTHCAGVCHALCVTLATLEVDAAPLRGESPEAAARAARYTALAGWLPPGHCLLTAQHQDDQAETVLLQLARGSGVHGLAAMPDSTGFGAGRLLRPLLGFSRQHLQHYAQSQQLCWVEDPSNADTAYTRNFLRHRVLDVLRERWPRVSDSLSRSAAHQAEAAQLLDTLADLDLVALDGGEGTLRVSGLQGLSPARQRNVLRRWLRGSTGTAPSRAVLVRILHDLPGSRPDAEPCVRWGAFELRRYRDRLHLLRRANTPAPAQTLHWSLDAPLVLPDGSVLQVIPARGQGIRQGVLAGGVRVGWRQGGERCRPAGRRHHHELRKLFQEGGIPPWERARTPLIFIDDALAAVAGLWVCEPFQARADEAGMQVCWKKA